MTYARGRHLTVTAASLALSLAACGLAANAGPRFPELRILERFSVPSAPSPPTDVRWAGDRTVYLSRLLDGVTEVALEAPLVPRRTLVPRNKSFRFYDFIRFAVTPDTLVVGSEAHDLAWRSLAPAADGSIEFQRWPVSAVEDLDLSGDRLVFLGVPPSTSPGQYSEIAWVGSIEKRLSDLKPLLKDASGDGARGFSNCSLFQVGAVRFLSEGSFLIVPGSQPGAFLYRADGTLARTWDTTALGLTTAAACQALPDEERRRLFRGPALRLPWIDRLHVLEDILPLPQGPGLLIRSWEQGSAHWVLRVLRAGGEILTFAVPLTSSTPGTRLRGDVRDGKIIFLLSAPARRAAALTDAPGELVTAELP